MGLAGHFCRFTGGAPSVSLSYALRSANAGCNQRRAQNRPPVQLGKILACILELSDCGRYSGPSHAQSWHSLPSGTDFPIERGKLPKARGEAGSRCRHRSTIGGVLRGFWWGLFGEAVPVNGQPRKVFVGLGNLLHNVPALWAAKLVSHLTRPFCAIEPMFRWKDNLGHYTPLRITNAVELGKVRQANSPITNAR